MIRLIVGLGNPSEKYHGTRHNIGYEIADFFAKNQKASFRKWKNQAHLAHLEGRLSLMKPLLFMNESGAPVRKWCHEKGIPSEEVLVALDDFSLPFGTLRLRSKGSSGGHKGLESILQALGSGNVPRLRAGIGPLPDREDPAEFVLSRFRADEKKRLPDFLAVASEAISLALEDFDKAMNRFNTSQEAAP